MVHTKLGYNANAQPGDSSVVSCFKSPTKSKNSSIVAGCSIAVKIQMTAGHKILAIRAVEPRYYLIVVSDMSVSPYNSFKMKSIRIMIGGLF
jgi:hypothetical protein